MSEKTNSLRSFCARSSCVLPVRPKTNRALRHVQMRQLDLSKFKKFTRSIRQKEIQIVKEQEINWGRTAINFENFVVSTLANLIAVRPRLIVSNGVSKKNWWSQAGSNRRPPACKAGALPAELWPQALVGLGRFELPTSPLSGVRSNQLSYRPKVSRFLNMQKLEAQVRC